ncbi:MAG: response regulator [Eubacterium sp.]|nr:response regulator [Eubacterium sp.]
MKEKVLIVDDVEVNREILKDILEDRFETIEAADGAEAIEKIKEYSRGLSLVFLDRIMPVKSGTEVLKYMNLQGLTDKIPVIMITGDESAEDDVRTYDLGAADIIYKPFEPDVIRKRAENLIELFYKREKIEEELANRTRALAESRRQAVKTTEFLLNALGTIVEFRSAESSEHPQRIIAFTKILLDHIRVDYPEYNLTRGQVETAAQAAALHDIGKIAIADSILKKPGKLTEEEFEEMKKHTEIGCEILEKFKMGENEFYQYAYDICRWHHEKYDGGGYPDGLKGDDIPIWAQAAGVADCFDALVSKRVYKEAYSQEDAFNMIMDGECGVFSEKMLDCFSRSYREITDLINNKYKYEGE